MDTKELIRSGQLALARESAVNDVKSAPADLGKRFLLFQVLVFLGEWDKAEKHLDLMGGVNSELTVTIQSYKNALSAEKSRDSFWTQGELPDFLPEKPFYAPIYAELLSCYLAKDTPQAREILEKLWEELPEVKVSKDGKSLSGFHNSDSLLCFFLEAFVYDKYVLVPLADIRELVIASPETLMDLMWAHGQLTTWGGLTLNCQLPVLYPRSHSHQDDKVKLGRLTDWVELGDGLYRGVGQQVFVSTEGDLPILEVGEISFVNQGAADG